MDEFRMLSIVERSEMELEATRSGAMFQNPALEVGDGMQ